MILIQVILAAVVLARQHDVDLVFYDAWGEAKLNNEAVLEKIEKSVQKLIFIFSTIVVATLL